jgi:hypothetical protein
MNLSISLIIVLPQRLQYWNIFSMDHSGFNASRERNMAGNTKPRFLISYARSDGEAFATQLHHKPEAKSI